MTVRSNRQILSSGKVYKQKAGKKFGTDEVTFNKESRLEYLTGFHKRKLERQKKAKEFNTEQERKARVEERAKLREEKKKEMERQLKEFKESMKLVGDYRGSDDEDDEVEEEADDWKGFSEDEKDIVEDSDGDSSEPIKPILRKHIQVYQDDTRVDIEPLEPNENFEYLAKINNVKLDVSAKVLDESIERAKKYAKFLGVEDKAKSKKKKFRYLTKSERKQNQRKAVRNKQRN